MLMTLPSSLFVYSTFRGGRESALPMPLPELSWGSKRAAKGVIELVLGWVRGPGTEPGTELEPVSKPESGRSAGGMSTSGGSSLLLLLLAALGKLVVPLPGSGSVTLDGKAEEAVGRLVKGRGGLVGDWLLELLAAGWLPKLSGSKGTPGPTSG